MPHVIVTGGFQGLGHAVAALLAGHGDHVTLIARDPSRLEAAASAISGDVGWEAADVTDRDQLERGTGAIVGIASTAALVGVFGYAAYAPSKFAVRGLMEVIRSELKPHGIHVGCVFPPAMDTPGFATENRTKPEEGARISAAVKPRQPDDVARAIVRGIDRHKFVITADPQTAVLARIAGLLAPVLHRLVDRTVLDVQGDRARQS